MSDENVEGLRAAVNAAQAEIGRIQSAAMVLQDRADGALAIMGRLSDGSSNPQLEAAITAIGSIPLTVEEIVSKTAEAVDNLEAYAATR